MTDIQPTQQDATNLRLLNEIIRRITSEQDLSKRYVYQYRLKLCLMERDETLFNIMLSNLNSVISITM